MANDVPRHFADFVKQNADEHGQLAARIEASHGRLTTEIAKAETRTTRWFIAALAVGVSILATIILIVN